MAYGSPAENQNKGYAKQEVKDLLKDNPIARDASGDRPWITKHYSSTMGSPVKMGHESPNEMGHADSPVEGNAFTKAMADAGGDYDKAKSMLKMNYDSAVAKKKCHHNR
tara:strand:+ start:119 stop:445 length:327 start_codon:yes stop_codon:yes gene_type:complete